MTAKNTIPQVNFDLLAKYDASGPRYTSYPTAPHFHHGFSWKEFREEIIKTNEAAEPPELSLYFHLPFCESVCFFCGCNVTFTSDRKRPIGYTQLLIKEMDAVAPLIRKGRKVRQLHWGGGTPTFFTPEQLKLLHHATKERFEFVPDAEIGLEVDPRETTTEHLKALQELGFNRLSMGVQDFDPQVQKAVNRIQSEEVTRATINQARACGFQSVSLDLIYGLPFQNVESFSKTLEKILSLNPDRIALFNFAYLPEMIRHQKAIKADALPSPQVKMEILRLAIQRFNEGGYRYIGMDHFARPDDPLCRAQDNGTLYRNFQGYTTHAGCDLYAFGVSAISQVGQTYAQNQKNVHEYEKAVLEHGLATQRGIQLQKEDELRREVIMRLLCNFELEPAMLEKRFDINFEEHFAEALSAIEPMEADGLLKYEGRRLVVTPAGRLLIRNICMPFDGRMKEKPNTKFSRTV